VGEITRKWPASKIADGLRGKIQLLRKFE
jgi:hypothetical protein